MNTCSTIQDFEPDMFRMVAAIETANLGIKELANLLVEINDLNREFQRRSEIDAANAEAAEQWLLSAKNAVFERVFGVSYENFLAGGSL
ncbi:hypothetical protein ACDY97_30305 [Rhizobium mongolense]|uniref:hypothetical protein n=1 Tax=Rhizobium mongolense TaxID=57676 RepID=UPI003557F1BD